MFLFFKSTYAIAWVHIEMRGITQKSVNGQTYYTLSHKSGVLSPTTSSSCGSKSSACLLNMPSDIEVLAPDSNQESLVSLIASFESEGPFDDEGSLELPGNLLPTVNDNMHSSYFFQLVFNNPDKKCNDFSQLAQIVMTPVYEQCTKIIEVDGNSYFTKTVFDNANQTLPVAKDFYCIDSGCSNCIPGIYWELRPDCVLNSVSDQLSSAYFGYVGPEGLTMSFNGSSPSITKSAPGTTAKPEPTSLYNSATLSTIFSPFWILMF